MSRRGLDSILAIDLGTTKCMACVPTDSTKDPEVIIPDPVNYPGLESMPSAFCMMPGGPVFGEQAVNKLCNPKYRNDVVRFVKRSMRKPQRTFSSGGQEFTPVQISGNFLHHLKKRAQEQLKADVSDAVITVPAYFGNVERQATREAAERYAGFDQNRVHLLDEPIAAAYGLNLHRERGEKLIMVADLGGGTFDVTLLLIGRHVQEGGFYELGRDGDSKLGGLNWDREIGEMAVNKLDIRPPAEFLEVDNVDLYRNCENAKIQMCRSTLEHHDIQVNFDNHPRTATIERAEFFANTHHLAERCGLICERLMEDVPNCELPSRKGRLWFRREKPHSGTCTWEDIDRVLLVGGGSLMPAVQREIEERSKKKVQVVEKPLHQVAFGAARVAAEFAKDPEIFDHLHVRVPHSIGVWCYPDGNQNGRRRFDAIIERNTRLPLVEPVAKSFRIGGGDGKTRLVEVVEQRKELERRTNRRALEHATIAPCHLTGLPRRMDNGAQTLVIRLRYFSNRNIEFSGTIAGREFEVKIVDGVVEFKLKPPRDD